MKRWFKQEPKEEPKISEEEIEENRRYFSYFKGQQVMPEGVTMLEEDGMAWIFYKAPGDFYRGGAFTQDFACPISFYMAPFQFQATLIKQYNKMAIQIASKNGKEGV